MDGLGVNMMPSIPYHSAYIGCLPMERAKEYDLAAMWQTYDNVGIE